MGNIVLLDDLTINKIAAGEVIERPASVVKEMLENSIDAGATKINIDVQNGGISKIRISDNGKGIEPDDMLIAFERHATSKIRQADDLEFVRTMGFRGEALASIAAIARVEMVSRTANSETGYKVVVEGGNIISEEMTACSIGTTITVEKLFYNTPVRYKFLKKDYTEAGYIEDAVKRIALVNANISIKLINNGKTIIQTNGNGKLEDIIYGIYGKYIVEGLLPMDYKYENIFIKGVIGKPEIARSNRSNQMFFINKRYVKDKTLSAAVEQAMKGMLPVGKFPFLVMNIEMDPSKVDVNVHPAKTEVRFVEESEIFKAVMYAIKESLLAGSLISNASKEKNIDQIYQEHYDNKVNMEQLKEEVKNHKIRNEVIGLHQNINNTNDSAKEEPKKVAKNIVDLFKKVTKDKEREAEEKMRRDNVNYNIFTNNEPMTQAESATNIISDIFMEKEKNRINGNTQAIATNIYKEHTQAIKTDLYQNNVSNTIANNLGETKAYKFDMENLNSNTEYSHNNEFKPFNGLSGNKNEFNNKVEEDNFDYLADNLYQFEGLKQIQNDVLKDIEKMPVLTEEKAINIAEDMYNQGTYIGQGQAIPQNPVLPQNQVIEEEPQNFEDMYEKTFGTVPASVKRQEIKIDNLKYVESENISMFTKNEKYAGYKYIGTVFSTYIILEVEEEMYILDQHAAHERIMYEKVKENYYNGNKDCQMMLLPDVINLTNKDICILRENKEIFEKAGFVVEEFGDKTVKLMGVPSHCMEMDTKSLFLDILDEIDTVARTERQEIEEKFIATVACKSAVKANMHLEVEEVITLLDTLMQLPNPFTCPHGRPTAIKMTKNDIEKKFNRR